LYLDLPAVGRTDRVLVVASWGLGKGKTKCRTMVVWLERKQQLQCLGFAFVCFFTPQSRAVPSWRSCGNGVNEKVLVVSCGGF
jgi:hypothetical protein